jgi:hypothetical protein
MGHGNYRELRRNSPRRVNCDAITRCAPATTATLTVTLLMLPSAAQEASFARMTNRFKGTAEIKDKHNEVTTATPGLGNSQLQRVS